MPSIWIVNQFANTHDFPGHSRHFEIALGLIERGWDVEIFASDFNLSQRRYLKLNKFQFFKSEFIEGISWTWLKVLPYSNNDWKRYLNMASFCASLSPFLICKLFFLRLFNKTPNIIFSSSPQLPAVFITMIIAKIFGIPFVSEIRDLWPDILVDLGGMSQNNRIVKILSYIEKKIYKNSDLIICLAEGVKNCISNRGGKKIIWLPNGPDLNLFKQMPLLFENQKFDAARPFDLIYAGAHGSANALDNIIKSAKILEMRNLPVRIFLLGDGPEKKNLIKQAIGLKNVFFIDPIPKNKIPIFMKKADAILLSLDDIPLFRFGVSPNKLYDAYAIGRPLITTVPGNINDEIRRNKIGFTAEARNPEDLVKAITRLINTGRIERENMCLRARKLAETTYSRDKINIKINKILREIIKKKKKLKFQNKK